MIKFIDKRSGAHARHLARANLFSLRFPLNSTSLFNANFFCVLDSGEGCDVSRSPWDEGRAGRRTVSH